MMLAQEQSITIPLFGFNVGLEIGQIAVVIIVLSIFYFLHFFKIAEKTLDSLGFSSYFSCFS